MHRTNKLYVVLMCWICVILLLLSLSGCNGKSSKTFEQMDLLRQSNQKYGDHFGMRQKREDTEHFIISRMSGPSGVFTNYRDTLQVDNVATGHEVLSESAGLLMRYYALTNQEDLFIAEWEQAKKIFELPSGFSYRYSPKFDKIYNINATVDDLRIIRALYEAGLHFKQNEFSKLASIYGESFVKHNIIDGKLFDFYDQENKMTNDFVTLCYIDLTSLRLLPIPQTKRDNLINDMENVIHNGFISEIFPFYETRYNYETLTYSSEGINTVESLLTILSLAESGKQRPESIAYIKEKVRSGTLYGKYTKDGTPMNDIQSTAIYAITALIGSVLHDPNLYMESIEQMEKFRVEQTNELFFGGFGDPTTETAFSFDNLMALLAYAY